MRSWGVCVRAVCAIVGEHVETRGWPCLSKLLSTIFSETWSLITEAGTCQFGWIGWAMRSMDPPASTFLELGLQAGKALPILDMGDENPNSGPHVYTENILPTEPPSQPPRLMLDPPVSITIPMQSVSKPLDSTHFLSLASGLPPFPPPHLSS